MQVTKLRISADDQGLVQAGKYFQRLADGLRRANEIEARRAARLEAQDRRLEARYRRKPAAKRERVYVSASGSEMTPMR